MQTVAELRADRPWEVLRARYLSVVAMVVWLVDARYLYPPTTGPYLGDDQQYG